MPQHMTCCGSVSCPHFFLILNFEMKELGSGSERLSDLPKETQPGHDTDRT